MTKYPWTNRDRAIIRQIIKTHLDNGKGLTYIKIAVRASTRLDYWYSVNLPYMH